MGRVRQKGSAAELKVAAALRSVGVAYRKNVRALPGSPDFANRKRRWAVFVNGCFWHQHTGCSRATVPKANHCFWVEKFATNRKRDARAVRALRQAGFRVAIIWECEADSAESKLSKVFEPRRVDMS
jgi:DNA mismatch endonuclease Vsr